ncbi:exocyst complex component EXO70I-like [Arachis stenosperma]|uniref:exocyst complex component EXO70I-like n=1 Tax=Arachis stenosperma TaxID=217475 RepID=UPI0025AC634E|nr:exocyst complex component EXO70I-like [Arachis stenosperma]
MAPLTPKSNDNEDPEENQALNKLEAACSDLESFLRATEIMEHNLVTMETRFDLLQGSLSNASRRITPLQSLAMSRKALETRINRAVSPALELIETFKVAESLQHRILDLSAKLLAERTQQKRLQKLLEYADCVDRLNEAINSICQVGEGVILKLQEVVEFISRTKAADQYRTQRLREALATLKALYETEVDEMRFEGLLDQALLHMQDEFEAILLSIKHKNLGDMSQLQYDDDENNNDTNNELVNNNFAACELGSELEVEVLRRISFTLAANDCLDICIDIYVKVRYRRAAKALMKLNPDYLKTYTPEGIDEMEWETLESAITLWTQHFQVAVRKVLKSEKSLCQRVLGTIMDGLVWPECFVKISDKIMAVFFRFGEGVARSSKEPQKLFKLLDMFESLERLKEHVLETFEGESGVDICTRFRELEKLIIDASSKVFWEFGLQIEGNADGLPPSQDGSVPKLVRYAINYLKYLASENYRTSMAKVLRTEQIWKNGILSKQETDESLLKNAISNVMEALERNIESKRSRCRDKILVQVFLMNTYWYIYMRTKNTELGELLGDQYMKIGYKTVAEESAYLYQKQSWGVLVAILDGGDVQEHGKDSIGRLVNEKMESFFKCLNEVCERHIRGGYSIPDLDLREQMRESTMKLVVPAYVEFLESYSGFLQRKMYPSPDKLRGMVRKAFDGGEGRPRRRGSTSNDRNAGGNSASLEGDIRDLRPSRSNSQDV